jgi:predicted RNase H-like HicB family nuclease
MLSLDLRPAYHVRYENVAQFSDDPFGWFIWVEELPGVWATAPTPDGVEDAARAAIASALDVAPEAFDVEAEDRSKRNDRPRMSPRRVANSQEDKDVPRVTVGPRTGGGWEVTGEDRMYPTQADAQQAARRHLKASGGGELVVKGRDGRVRMQNTIGRPDPRKSKG